jgi:hypothetical protein
VSNDGQRYLISTMSGASSAEDRSFVDLEFKTEDGDKVTFRMTPMSADQIAGKLGEFVLFIRSQTLSKGDHFAIHASEAVDLTAAAAAGGEKVILSVKGTIALFRVADAPLAALRRVLCKNRDRVSSRARCKATIGAAENLQAAPLIPT